VQALFWNNYFSFPSHASRDESSDDGEGGSKPSPTKVCVCA